MITNHSNIIIRPRITEKSGVLSESSNVYTFEVIKSADKNSINKTIKSLYKVTPKKIRIVNLPEKNVIVKGRKGTKPSVKKAIVYLKKGDKIEFI